MGCENCKCVKKQEGGNEFHLGNNPSNFAQFDTENLANLEKRNKNLFHDTPQTTEYNNIDTLKSLTTNNLNTNKETLNTKEIPERNESENESMSSNFLSVNQERNDSLFDYFNNIRLNPLKYDKEAESHGLLELVQNAKLTNDSTKAIIKNPFFNIALDEYINKSKGNIDDESEIMKDIDNDNQLNNYEKELYIVEANSDNASEAVWNLLEENKHRNKSNLLTDKIDILVIASSPIRGTQNFKAYFLFLKTKN